MKSGVKNEQKDGLRIGELARRAAVTPRTIRFYIQEGLLPEPLYSKRNTAFYGEDLIEKIRAIKQAQKERYLPLVVIRKILKKNKYDYGALDKEPSVGKKDDQASLIDRFQIEKQIPKKIPKKILKEIERQQWGTQVEKGPEREIFKQDPILLKYLVELNKYGRSWEELIDSLKELQHIVGELVEVEFHTLISLLMKTPGEGFNQILEMEEVAFGNFIRAIRSKQLKKIVNQHKKSMDNAYRASTDEGFAVQFAVIQSELLGLEKKLPRGELNIRILNDLSIGYSCAGELDKAINYLRRVTKKYPEDLETKVRWLWHKRFSKRPGETLKLKKELVTLVENHPDYAFARGFLAMWHFMDVFMYDDHSRILQAINLSIDQLDQADKGKTSDMHEWMVVKYFKGRILTAIHSPNEYVDKGIDAFHEIINKKKALDRLYSKRMPFYGDWIWPNVYIFLGIAYLRSEQYDDALEILKKGEGYQMMPPFMERLQQYKEEAMMKSKVQTVATPMP